MNQSIPQDHDKDCCRIEAIVNVDSKGQIVLPKSLREKHHLQKGDKLAIVSLDTGTENCICLLKTAQLNHWAKKFLDPMLNVDKE